MKIRTPHKHLLGKFAEELIEGGKADGKDPKAPQEEKSKGHKVEMEHTNDKEVAKEITKDHLEEDPKYYKKLDKMENPPKLTKEQEVLVRYLKDNPKPKDEGKGGLHELADKNKINKHKMEEGAYSLLAEYTNTFQDKKK